MLQALDTATDEFGRRLAAVDERGWALPTPCPDWDVHFLAAHVIGGNRFATAILTGTPAADAIAEVMSAPQLGDDPMQSWATTCAAQAASFRAPSALDRRIEHPIGEITGGEFLKFRIFDITLHAWDLARSIGTDQQLDAALIDLVLDIVQHGPPGMGFGIAALRTAPSSASPQDRLLDLAGRSSH